MRSKTNGPHGPSTPKTDEHMFVAPFIILAIIAVIFGGIPLVGCAIASRR